MSSSSSSSAPPSSRGVQQQVRDDDHIGVSNDEVGDEDTGMMDDSHTESFVYIDDNGDTVAPEEETSWLMALGIRQHGGGGNGRGNHDNDGARHSSCSTSSIVTSAEEVPYFEDPAEFERERLLADKRFKDALKRAATSNQQSDEDDDEEYIEGDATIVADVNDDGQKDEDEAMGCRTFSREATCNEDEWILECILDKRVLRPTASTTNATTTDYKVIYDDFGNKETVIVSAGRTEYLCKWKWYVEPTWEGQELLEDEGFIRECRAFDEAAAKTTTSSTKAITAAIAKVAPLWSDLHPEFAVKVKRKKKSDRPSGRFYKETVFGDLTTLSAISGLNMDEQADIFKRKLMTLYGHGVCATDDQIAAFMQEFNSKRKTHRPMLLYHGSQIHNLPSICKNGLRVPRSRKDVVNGQAQGMGIYAAFDPSVSVSYCRAASRCRLLLCVALVSPNDKDITMVPGFCIVFKKSSLILPVMALDVSLGIPMLAAIERQIHTYESLAYLSPPVGIINIAAAERKKRELYGDDVVSTEEKARAMCKVRSKNILNINRLAEKAAAAASAAATVSSPKKISTY